MLKAEKQPETQAHILVLESDEKKMNSLCHCVENALTQTLKQHLDVCGFVQPGKAMRFIEQHDCPILFTGVELRGTNGLEVTKKLQSAFPDINIILITAYREYVLQALQMQLRISGYLVTPTVAGVRDQLENVSFPVEALSGN